jgi:hypothetical protein
MIHSTSIDSEEGIDERSNVQFGRLSRIAILFVVGVEFDVSAGCGWPEIR